MCIFRGNKKIRKPIASFINFCDKFYTTLPLPSSSSQARPFHSNLPTPTKNVLLPSSEFKPDNKFKMLQALLQEQLSVWAEPLSNDAKLITKHRLYFVVIIVYY